MTKLWFVINEKTGDPVVRYNGGYGYEREGDATALLNRQLSRHKKVCEAEGWTFKKVWLDIGWNPKHGT